MNRIAFNASVRNPREGSNRWKLNKNDKKGWDQRGKRNERKKYEKRIPPAENLEEAE